MIYKNKLALSIAATLLAWNSNSMAAPWIKISSKEIAGVVSGTNGPEAGVWVIAETTDLPTKFAKVVVTDDQGHFVLPQMPKAHYQVWVRGYGLTDSPKVSASTGELLDLKAIPAPTPQEEAKYFPGMYWYSMIDLPKASEFPGTGEKGNGIPTFMKSQAYWVDTMKNSCQSCHALGDRIAGIKADRVENCACGDVCQGEAELWCLSIGVRVGVRIFQHGRKTKIEV